MPDLSGLQELRSKPASCTTRVIRIVPSQDSHSPSMCGYRALFQSYTPVAIYLRNWIMLLPACLDCLHMGDRILFDGIATWLLTLKFAEGTGSPPRPTSPSTPEFPKSCSLTSILLAGVYILQYSALVLPPRASCAAVCILRTRLKCCSLVLPELRSSSRYTPLQSVYVLPSSSATLV